ncbi:MAG TPA: metal-dependent transcriptional regulator [Mycobacteriales bacterium]|nr:metal-dependent transcriptional regulator [Mycobacteriales bacterium]
MNELVDTTEMYLKRVFELEEENITPLRARIAERLKQSGPTVSQTVARMERDGLLRVEGDRHLEFTTAGRNRATAVMRKHRLAELLLLRVIGMEWADVHVEACRWEHVMSEDVERKLVVLLDNPVEDPYGNPIPGLAEIGAKPAPEFPHKLMTLEAAAATASGTAEGRSATVHRISEQIQVDPELMRMIEKAGLQPGRSITAKPGSDGGVTVKSADAEDGVEVDRTVAIHLYVSAA